MEESVLTNRELAALIILVLLTAFVMTRSTRAEVLESVRGVLMAFREPSILVPVLLYVGWISASVAGASRFGLWDFGLLKATILWLLLSGLVCRSDRNADFNSFTLADRLKDAKGRVR